MMQTLIACVTRAWRSFGRLSGSQPSAWFWAWPWDPLRFARRHPPHHLSPAWADHPAGPDPEARLSRPKSPQQRSDQTRKPVNSEPDNCSFSSIALTPNAYHSEGIGAAKRLPLRTSCRQLTVGARSCPRCGVVRGSAAKRNFSRPHTANWLWVLGIQDVVERRRAGALLAACGRLQNGRISPTLPKARKDDLGR